jgi:hypothetical protein
MNMPTLLVWIFAALLPAVGLSGCLHGDESRRTPAESADAQAHSGGVKVSRHGSLAVPYVTGNRAFGVREGRSEPIRLAGGIVSTFIATLSPAAVPDPAGRRLAYNSWHGKGPAIRVHDLRTGDDRVLDVGAYSVAWRGDGALASFKSRHPEIDLRRERPLGHVVVRRSATARPVRWTARPGRYVVAAWARDRLLVYRVQPGKAGWPDLLVFDGALRPRVLARDSGLVSVSPDGRHVFVSAYGSAPALVRVLDVARGDEQARRTLAADQAEWVMESGSWEGDLVTAKASPGVLVFGVGRAGIEVDQVLRFDGSEYPLGVFEPRSNPSGRRLALWAQRAQEPRQPLPQAAVLSCDRLTRRCVEGPATSSGREPRLVYNPSRP